MLMKKILVFALILISLLGKAQNPLVEKSVFGLQTGFLGIYFQNESRLINNVSLRSEIGLDSQIWGGSFFGKNGFAMVPVLTLEPRFYYNLKKRVSKSQIIDNNSGNFFSLVTSYHPDLFVLSNYDDMALIPDITIIPTWGIRRHIGNHFNYEAGLGFGRQITFTKKQGYDENESETAVNLLLRTGYTF
jgi:hypothetical protein